MKLASNFGSKKSKKSTNLKLLALDNAKNKPKPSNLSRKKLPYTLPTKSPNSTTPAPSNYRKPTRPLAKNWPKNTKNQGPNLAANRNLLYIKITLVTTVLSKILAVYPPHKSRHQCRITGTVKVYQAVEISLIKF